jgi:hypothetical protein
MNTSDTIILAQWQTQRAKNIPPDRRLDEQFERDLDVIRKCIERKE